MLILTLYQLQTVCFIIKIRMTLFQCEAVTQKIRLENDLRRLLLKTFYRWQNNSRRFGFDNLSHLIIAHWTNSLLN